MTLSIEMTPEIEKLLREHAAAAGKDPAAFAAELVVRGLARRTAEAALDPFRRQVAESGMSDEALDQFYRELRNEARAERRGDAA